MKLMLKKLLVTLHTGIAQYCFNTKSILRFTQEISIN